MSVISIQALGTKLVEERGDRGVREVAQEIGISPATLSRIENGHVPDLQTFKRICDWLKIEPGEILGAKPSGNDKLQAAVHFKKQQALSPKTAKSLANMILAAQRSISFQESQEEEV